MDWFNVLKVRENYVLYNHNVEVYRVPVSEIGSGDVFIKVVQYYKKHLTCKK